MRLLIDQNLSPHLVELLQDVYPNSIHVRQLGLESEDDAVIWRYATDHSLLIVSKDADFHQRSFLFGHPPKVIWIRLGNCSTTRVEELLRSAHHAIAAFWADDEAAFLILPNLLAGR